MLYTLTWSVIRQVGLWNTSDLDFVLIEGDKLYKYLRATSFLSVDDLVLSASANFFNTTLMLLFFLNFTSESSHVSTIYTLLI